VLNIQYDIVFPEPSILFLCYYMTHDCYCDHYVTLNPIPSSVVATTRWNSTCDMLTSAKLSVGYLVVRITRELNKEPSLHCYSIYISYKWSMLQQCVYLMSTLQWLCKTVHSALMSMCPTCSSNVVYMLSDIII